MALIVGWRGITWPGELLLWTYNLLLQKHLDTNVSFSTGAFLALGTD